MVSLVILLTIGGVTVSAESGELPATAFSFTYDEEKTNIQDDGDNEITSSPMTGDNGYTGWIVLMAVSGACLIATTYTIRKRSHNN